MGNFKAFKTGLSFAWKGINKGEVNPKTIRYIHPEKISSSIDGFVKTVPKELDTIKKVVTDKDRFAFKAYMFMKNLDLKITADEIKTLFKYEGEKYQQKAFEFLTKKMNIPKELEPQVFQLEDNAEWLMAYVPIMNAIKINKAYTKNLSDKTFYLGTLRHELQHWVQNMKCLTHETKGEEFVNMFRDFNVKKSIENLDNQVKNVDIEELKKMYPPEFIENVIVYLKNCLKTNSIQEYEHFMKEIKSVWTNSFNQQFSNLRKTAIKNFGILKEGTKEAKRAEKMITEAMEENGYMQKGRVNMGKYLVDCRENEALIAQAALVTKIEGFEGKNFCFIKEARQLAKNPNAAETLKQMDTEIDSRFTTEEFASYLYD